MIYTYNIQFNAAILENEIKNQIYGNLYKTICGLGNQIEIHFHDSLSSEDKNHLDALVSNHEATFQSSFDYIFLAARSTQEENIAFGQRLLHDWMRRNTLEGMNVKQSLWIFARFEDFEIQCDFGLKKVDLFKMFYAGALPTVYYCLLQVQPDSMTEDHHWLTQERLDWVKEQLEDHLGAGMVNYIQQLQASEED